MASPVKSTLVVRPAKAYFYFFVSVFIIVIGMVSFSKQTLLLTKIEVVVILAIPIIITLYAMWTKNIITLSDSALTIVNIKSKGIFNTSRTRTISLNEIRLIEADSNLLEVTNMANNKYQMKMGVFTKPSIVQLLVVLQQQGVKVISHF